MSFGERIKARREELQIKQEDVAGYINENLSHQAVGKWERDESYPQVEKLLLLAVKLDMSLDDMFADELAYLKRNNKNDDEFFKKYPGLISGLKTLAKIIDNV